MSFFAKIVDDDGDKFIINLDKVIFICPDKDNKDRTAIYLDYNVKLTSKINYDDIELRIREHTENSYTLKGNGL